MKLMTVANPDSKVAHLTHYGPEMFAICGVRLHPGFTIEYVAEWEDDHLDIDYSPPRTPCSNCKRLQEPMLAFLALGDVAK